MSEREIREILRLVRERLARRIAVPAALGALVLAPGCTDEGGATEADAGRDGVVSPDGADDPGPDGFPPADEQAGEGAGADVDGGPAILYGAP